MSLAGDPNAIWRPRPEKESMVRSYLSHMGWALFAQRHGISGTVIADWRARLAREPTAANRSDF